MASGPTGAPAARLGGTADVDAACRTLALAFEHDPVWGDWAFPEPAGRVDRLTAYWRPYVENAVRFGGLHVAGDAAVVAVWVPPGTDELDAQGEAELDTVLERLAPDRVAAFHEGFDRFEAAHPRAEPHWYLTLLGTHPDHRGRGLGMAVVAEQLARADADGLAAYLESSNDANLARYAQAGFRPHGTFAMPDGPTLTTMWRPAVRT